MNDYTLGPGTVRCPKEAKRYESGDYESCDTEPDVPFPEGADPTK